MADPFRPIQRQKYAMSWTEVATALVKAHDIHEGLWQVYFAFGIHGATVNFKGAMTPSALVPLVEVGLSRAAEETEMTVDAAVVNPRPQIIIPAVAVH
jgi:hypothetical protein